MLFTWVNASVGRLNAVDLLFTSKKKKIPVSPHKENLVSIIGVNVCDVMWNPNLIMAVLWVDTFTHLIDFDLPH